MFRTGGGWQDRRPAQEVAPGIYAADFRPNLPGVYHVCVACASAGLRLDNPGMLVIHVEDLGLIGPTSKQARMPSL
jgi:hypothetical protein